MGSDKGEIRMEDTALKTMFICHPQYRNRYNKVFGGFIMRQACELAFTNTFLYVWVNVNGEEEDKDLSDLTFIGFKIGKDDQNWYILMT